ncbi:MAG: site-specific DNA-methyltransferase [Phaeodactylibacter sp.]|nr:site-specific DNA-methyltransferase [Phaeodactylibacter sp.]
MVNVIDQVKLEDYAIYHADTVEVAKELPENSIDFSVFSPPFESLYTYSNSDRDMGNSKNSRQFWDQYLYLIKEQFRAMKPGRIIAVHCMNLPTIKQNDGFIGIRDFRGEIIREYQKAGFIYHSEVVIWKDPVVAMQRTKALGLLHKTIKKDSAMSRMSIPDTLVMFRKPGDNENPISGEFTYYVGTEPAHGFQRHDWDDERQAWTVVDGSQNTSVDVWQRYASPVWMDINQSDTLNFREGRDSDDERHICPLQLDVIQRCLQLWSNPGDVVWSPFMGVGSEGYMSLKAGRKFIGAELKESYFKLAQRNLKAAKQTQYDLF